MSYLAGCLRFGYNYGRFSTCVGCCGVVWVGGAAFVVGFVCWLAVDGLVWGFGVVGCLSVV